jgi:hypothetical protein
LFLKLLHPIPIVPPNNYDVIFEEAFIVVDNSQRIYILEIKYDNGVYFRPTTVKTEMTSDNYTEILSSIPEREIVVKGVYNLPSE